jgi:6-phosphofructokinase 1
LKIGVLTGGGDCPGINAIIQGIVTSSYDHNHEVLGILYGYLGLLKGYVKPLSIDDLEGVFKTGGTILGTSRTNPFKRSNGLRQVRETLDEFDIDALIAIGGDDTLGVADRLFNEGIRIVGVPKTIDNDLFGIDYSTGFSTAIDVAAEAIERIHTTAKSHQRVIVVEIMGRYTGWLTLMAGLAGGAHIILIPELDFEIDEVCRIINNRQAEGKTYTIVAVAEGAKLNDSERLNIVDNEKEEFGHSRLGGIAKILEKEIAKRTGKETRSVVLGHIQRGGPPNSVDRILGLRLGLLSIKLIKQKKFGYAACMKNNKVVPIKIHDLVQKQRDVDENLLVLSKFFSRPYKD